MAVTQDDLVGAVTKLNELTRTQRLKWEPCNPPIQKKAFGLGRLDHLGTKSFQAVHEGRVLRITEYVSEFAAFGGKSFKYTLDIRDQDGSSVFEFPDVAGISDLFRSVQTQKLDIEGFIRKLVTN
ncbi:MAG TPA: hypothetical protein VND87_02260 [Stellaceae bacterium]|nr:hypothetical protein [Stellaceae bacterium]